MSMNGFQALGLGMSSQLPMKASKKKTANVMVGNSMRRPVPQSRERDDRSPAGVRRREAASRSGASHIMSA